MRFQRWALPASSLRCGGRQGSSLRFDELREHKTVRFALDCLPRCGSLVYRAAYAAQKPRVSNRRETLERDRELLCTRNGSNLLILRFRVNTLCLSGVGLLGLQGKPL